MQRLNNFECIPTDVPLRLMSFAFADASNDELKGLTDLGFVISIGAGKVTLVFDEYPYARLILEEIQYRDFADQAKDYMLVHLSDFSEEAESEIRKYIKEDLTINEILDQVHADWQLDEDGLKKLQQLKAEEMAEMSERSYQ